MHQDDSADPCQPEQINIGKYVKKYLLQFKNKYISCFFQENLKGDVYSFVNELIRLKIIPDKRHTNYFDWLKGCCVFACALLIFFSIKKIVNFQKTLITARNEYKSLHEH